jgi:hypothetical protein
MKVKLIKQEDIWKQIYLIKGFCKKSYIFDNKQKKFDRVKP